MREGVGPVGTKQDNLYLIQSRRGSEMPSLLEDYVHRR
jgi:hypothetical protein